MKKYKIICILVFLEFELGTLKEIGKGVAIGLLIDGAMGFIHFIANCLGLDSPFEFLLMEMPIWISVTVFIIVIPTVAFYIRSKYTSGEFFSYSQETRGL